MRKSRLRLAKMMLADFCRLNRIFADGGEQNWVLVGLCGENSVCRLADRREAPVVGFCG